MADEVLPKSGIYCIRNIVSGRVYVGSAINITQRWRSHLKSLRRNKHHSQIFQSSWNKHGESAFVFELLEYVDDLTKLIPREQSWIDFLYAACTRRGLNMYPTAGSPLGVKWSPEARAKASLMRRGRKLHPRTKEHAARISAAKKGKKASAETRAKQSASHTGKRKPPRTAEHCARISAAKKGRRGWSMPPRTAEHRAKISAAKKGQKRSMASRLKQSAATKGRRLAPEHLAKHRAILIARNKRMSTGDLTNQLNLF